MIKAKRSVIISLYVTMAIPVVAVVGFGFWLYADLYATSNRFQAEVANGSSENVPVEPDDFKRINVRSESESATRPFVQAAQTWERLAEADRNRLLTQLRLYATPREITEPSQTKAFTVCQPYMNLLRKAAAKPDSRFEREWTGDGSLLEPYYHTTVQFGRLMTSMALAEAKHGDYAQAFRDLHDVRRIAQHYSRDAGLDGLALHVNLETQAITAAQEIGFLYGNHPAVISQLNSFISRRSETKPNITRNLEGEAMRTLYVLSQEDSFKDRMFSGAHLTIRNKSFQRAAAVRMFEFWDMAIEKVKTVEQDPIAAALAFEEALADFERLRSPSRMIPIEIANWNAPRMELVASLEARYLLAKTGSDVISFYHRESKFPSSLSEVTSKAIDPYNDESLGYARTETGFILHSVGSDLHDDGGTQDLGNRDVVLSLEKGSFSLSGQ